MNADLFKSLLKPYWIAKTAKNFDEAADQISTAYHLANIGDTKTLFGAALISADKDILKTFLSIGLGVNFYLASAANAVASEVEVLNKPLFPDKIQIDKDGKRIKETSGTAGTSGTSGTSNTSGTSGTSGTSQLAENITNEVDNLTGNIGFKIIATGFCLYWITAKFSPMPPMPPMISPLNGVNVLFPGIPTDLAVDIRNAFSNTKIDDTIDALSLSFMKHLLTIGGIYSGYIFVGTTLVPMVLPWVTLLGSPPSLDNLDPSMSFEDIMKILKQELNKLIDSIDISAVISKAIGTITSVEILENFARSLGATVPDSPSKEEILTLIEEQLKNVKDPTKQLNGFLDVLDELNEENFTTLDLIALAKSFI